MIDPTAKLSVSRQAIVLGISRSSIYYQPRPVSDADRQLQNFVYKLGSAQLSWTFMRSCIALTTGFFNIETPSRSLFLQLGPRSIASAQTASSS